MVAQSHHEFARFSHADEFIARRHSVDADMIDLTMADLGDDQAGTDALQFADGLLPRWIVSCAPAGGLQIGDEDHVLAASGFF